MVDSTEESSTTQVGSTNLDNISDSSIEIERIINITKAGSDIVGRDQITATITINNYYPPDLVIAPSAKVPPQVGKDTLLSPYRGLYHFRPDDADLFFGRESFTQKLVDLVKERNFIALL